MMMYYLTFILSCNGYPDLPIFMRDVDAAKVAAIYGHLLLHPNGRPIRDGVIVECTATNIRFQEEFLK